MTTADITAALSSIRQETDLNAKSLLLAALVSELFRERGFEPVVVGGSAIEFYTDGAYMSGDTDICWANWTTPSEEQKEEIMRQIPGVRSHGGAKSWNIEGLWIDLLGDIDYLAEKDMVVLETQLGEVALIPVEDALVGRVYAARCYCSGYDEKDDDCAKKLMTAVLLGHVPIDWDEARKIAASPKFNCLAVFETVKAEVEAELAKSGF
ncbi:MAG: hypothetical protein IAE77_23915 [Prosthecobacter sp.]|jgi:hypothetical protein|uniref:hypothetical protein n=1 Tax=Prosthecobacter sp. TaxID=1965333 RepID=UPI0019DC3957|nr:hypothetical protein [Prosthecobacter sp.]MBE2286525.1 hypothetical protein [Prosthecobacter sp.]